MDKEQKQKINKKQKKSSIKNMGLDIDKNEYQEIVLSNSNRPESDYFKRDY